MSKTPRANKIAAALLASTIGIVLAGILFLGWSGALR
jgi:hypothetical protein